MYHGVSTSTPAPPQPEAPPKARGRRPLDNQRQGGGEAPQGAVSAQNAECLRIWRNAIDVLDSLYRVLLLEADRVRANPGAGLKPLRDLLNQTRPQTEEAQQLSLFVGMLAGFKRGEFISFAFKIKKACLLLLLGPRGALTALNLEEAVDIWLEEDGTYGIARTGRDPLAPARPPRPNTGRGEPGRPRKGARPERQPKKDGRRPAMEAAQYLQLLAQLDSAPRLGAPPTGESFPALPGAAKKADDARGGRQAAETPLTPAYAEVANGQLAAQSGPSVPVARAPQTWAEIEVPRTRAVSWYDMMSAVDEPHARNDAGLGDDYEPEELDPDSADEVAGAEAGDAQKGAPAQSGRPGAPAQGESENGAPAGHKG